MYVLKIIIVQLMMEMRLIIIARVESHSSTIVCDFKLDIDTHMYMQLIFFLCKVL